jgi:ABC-2 type transport system ATP-binding protein
MPVILQVRSVRKAYGAVRALDGVNLDVRRGEVHALLGTNGAGKTTLFRILMGIHLADAGSVKWDLAGPLGTQVGYLPEERGLQQDVPIERTLTFLGRLRGLDRAAARRATGAWLERLGLSQRAGDKLDTLSKGNQQKVQIAATLLHEPSFALLDEPFSGFDPVNQELLLELIGELRKRGATVLFSAHQLHLVERIAERVSLLHGGRMAVEGTLPELRAGLRQELCLLVELVDAAQAGVLSQLAHVAAVEQRERGGLRVRLAPDAELSQVLASLATAVRLRSVAVEEQGLHELYLGTVRGSAHSSGAQHA